LQKSDSGIYLALIKTWIILGRQNLPRNLWGQGTLKMDQNAEIWLKYKVHNVEISSASNLNKGLLKVKHDGLALNIERLSKLRPRFPSN
jgi:hypothetical protein